MKMNYKRPNWILVWASKLDSSLQMVAFQNVAALQWLDVVHIHNQAVLFILRKDALYQVVFHLFQINLLVHNSVGGCFNLALS